MARKKKQRTSAVERISLLLLIALPLAALAWFLWVYLQITRYASTDVAAPSDAIAVFGAAEYDGRPSPVLKARLDHAVTLYRHHLAPLIITLGGAGGDQYSEGEVARDYLLAQGIEEQHLLAETESHSTLEQAERIAVMAQANHLMRVIVVSDGAHLFRIHEICAAKGLDVLTSPRQRLRTVGGSGQWRSIAHEVLSYTLWRLHLY